MLLDANDLLRQIKKSAVDAVNATKPTAVILGTVTNISPLQINVSQKITLDSAQLILTRNVTDYEIEMTVDHETENASFLTLHTHVGGGSPAEFDSTHKHEYAGKKKFIVHSALKQNDRVIMMQEQGGQRFIVLDRVM